MVAKKASEATPELTDIRVRARKIGYLKKIIKKKKKQHKGRGKTN